MFFGPAKGDDTGVNALVNKRKNGVAVVLLLCWGQWTARSEIKGLSGVKLAELLSGPVAFVSLTAALVNCGESYD